MADINNISSSADVLKIYNEIKNGDDVLELCQRLGTDFDKLTAFINLAALEGKHVTIEDVDGRYVILKNRIYPKKSEVKPAIENLIHTQICAVSDTHLCSIWEQPTLLNKVYEECYNRGIEIVMHCGDVTDGDYLNNRSDDRYIIHKLGFTAQANYVVKMYPYVEGITTYYITGSHDETHHKNGGAVLADNLGKDRKDMVYLGQDQGRVTINNIDIMLKHPGGGNAMYLSTKLQNIIDAIDITSRPDLLLIGHYHKCYDAYYQNVWAYLVPCMVDQSNFMAKNSLANIVGAYFLDIYSQPDGTVEYIASEKLMFSPEDCIEEDYLTAKPLRIIK